MGRIELSVIIPTRNRLEKLANTIACLKRQSLAATDYEIIVVDDGSSPPVSLPDGAKEPRSRLLRLEGVERSAARNAGAAAAKGELLVFVDDDMMVATDFLATHLQAHREWPDALVVGAIRLPDDALKEPFGRFRQKLESQGAPQTRRLVSTPNFCAAANMSIPGDWFHSLGGFDCVIASSEDQDLAMRHTTRGGRIAYLPGAEAIHHDNALDIRSYCRRAEWGIENMIPFCLRYPNWPGNIEREIVNGPPRWGGEDLWQSLRKTGKAAFTAMPIKEILFGVAFLLEHLAPNGWALDRVYRLLLGIHIFRGYRRGLKRHKVTAGMNGGMSNSAQADAASD
jgi:GT2 family glycosyltransferase